MTTTETPPPQHDRIGDRSQLKPSRAIDLPRYLAWLTKPAMPIVERWGMKVPRRGPRGFSPSDVLLPDGYVAEVVATGLSAPVMATFGPDGTCYVVESGHKVDDPPCIRSVDLETGETTLVHQFGGPSWVHTGAVTGVAIAGDELLVTNTDRIVRVGRDGTETTIVDGLPGRGDHQVNHPLIGPDHKLYFGVGSATNAGVVGSDNAAYGWLKNNPTVHDVPAHDVVLAGRNYDDRDVIGDLRAIRTGAFVPFATETTAGQVIPGTVKASGAILRCNLDGTGLEVVAWGLRNPYGLAFAADGRLYATEHGMDNRSKRHIIGDFDDLYLIEEGRWYGWPDFASGIRLDDPRWGEGGQGREPVLAEFPDPDPPKPVVSFKPHAAANGIAISPGGAFGFDGQAFVALFGDLAPITTPRLATPVGFRVARVDLDRREIVDFAVNRIQGPASKLPHDGFERPSHCAFGPDGALYVTDFGEIDIAPEKAGIRVQAGSGSLWRIRRDQAVPAGELPPRPITVPFYAAQYATWAALLVGFVGAVAVGRRLLRR
ncbi:MAG TPA: PQQ-dependent sugar dehydrogenase [Candidatus Limnocylindrales bacterium]|nr:PQQ-dependent sugar dehydrogenase [Candidatus Limnocylindrales bacterium]